MTLAIRTILILTLILPIACAVSAQETTTEPTATTATTAAESTDTTSEPVRSSEEVRNQFTRLIEEHPAELSMLLKLDPSLLSNQEFLAGYPNVAQFIERNPEILRNPRFYLIQFPTPGRSAHSGPLEDFIEMVAVISGFGLALFAFIWFVRAVIDQRRWNRLSRTQSEVHNKILDRFASSDELLQYIKSPAGTKFLESAPIPLHTERPRQNGSLTRIMWSIQIGVVVAAGALGMLLVSLRFGGETGQGLFAMGAIAFCVGAGFVGSAIVSLILSRRLGMWAEARTAEALDDSGLVR